MVYTYSKRPRCEGIFPVKLNALIMPILWGMTWYFPCAVDSIALSGYETWFAAHTWYSNFPPSRRELWEHPRPALPLLASHPSGIDFPSDGANFPLHDDAEVRSGYRETSKLLKACRITVCLSLDTFRPTRLSSWTAVVQYRQQVPKCTHNCKVANQNVYIHKCNVANRNVHI